MILSPEQKLIVETAKDYSQKNIKPHSEKWAKNHEFPIETIKHLGELGFLGMLIPEEYGGSNIGHLGYALVIEEIAAADGSCSTYTSVHNSVASKPILTFGTTEQKEKYLKPLSSGKYLGAFCLTEPEAGSDAASIKTKAVKDGEHYILNGTKQFITAGKSADIAIVFAITNPELGKKGISAFIVPTKAPGYNVTRVESKMGQEALETAQLAFDNLKIPKENLLGKEGEGFKIALSNLESGRIGIAAQAVGMARNSYENALEYAKNRKSFGKNLFNHQAINFKLAEMDTQISAARQLIWHAADLLDNGQGSIKTSSQAKLFATDMAEKVCSDALQIFGGYGYLQDFPVERIYRDVRAASIYEGASEIQKIIIAKNL